MYIPEIAHIDLDRAIATARRSSEYTGNPILVYDLALNKTTPQWQARRYFEATVAQGELLQTINARKVRGEVLTEAEIACLRETSVKRWLRIIDYHVSYAAGPKLAKDVARA